MKKQKRLRQARFEIKVLKAGTASAFIRCIMYEQVQMLGCFPLVKRINIIKRTEESTEAMAAAAKTGIWPPNIKNNHNQSVATSQASFFFFSKADGLLPEEPTHADSKYKFAGQIRNIAR